MRVRGRPGGQCPPSVPESLPFPMQAPLLLAASAFAAGALNSIAGGGSFLTFPALVHAGVPPIPANATSAVAVFPGYLGGALGFRREIAQFEAPLRLRLAIASLVGGVIGALLLLVTPAKVFGMVVPWLLLFATVVFAISPKLLAWTRGLSVDPRKLLLPGTLAVSVYGGYFNGGLGILLMALFAAAGIRAVNMANGMKNALSFLLSGISVAVFAVAGVVRWPEAALMMAAATVGGYAGARLAKRLPAAWVRGFVVLVGLAMSVAFFLRG